MWGGSVALAYAVHGATVVLLAGALIWLWRSQVPFALRAAGLCIGTILATPYVLDYDLISLAIAIACLAVAGQREGFSPMRRPHWRRCGSSRW
jgi:hypothetical protein